MYTVKDISKITGLTPYTIRYYAKEGLLPTIKRNNHGVRQFKEADLEAIYIIECLKNCGMTIKEIKEFTDWTLEGDSTIDKRLRLFREKYEAMQEKIRQLKETLDALKYKVWFYEKAQEAGTIEVHDKMKPEEVPPEMKEIRDRMKHVERVARRNFWLESSLGEV